MYVIYEVANSSIMTSYYNTCLKLAARYHWYLQPSLNASFLRQSSAPMFKRFSRNRAISLTKWLKNGTFDKKPGPSKSGENTGLTGRLVTLRKNRSNPFDRVAGSIETTISKNRLWFCTQLTNAVVPNLKVLGRERAWVTLNPWRIC